MPIRSHLVDSLNRHGVFSSTDFLIVVQAIEGFYYRFRQDNNESLKTIIEDLTKEFSDVKCVEFEDGDCQKIVDSRHYFTHLLPPGKKAMLFKVQNCTIWILSLENFCYVVY